MKFKLNEDIFEYLNTLNEELDPSIDGDEILYEDKEFSRTPAEADKYRTETEEVLGFELNGNQVQYLATEWPAFYHNAKKHSKMKDQILSCLNDEGLLDDKQKEFDFNALDDEDDNIDFEDEPNDDKLHPNLNGDVGGNFKPLAVQSWDKPEHSEKGGSNVDDLANEQVEEDDFDTEDEEILNNILRGNS